MEHDPTPPPTNGRAGIREVYDLLGQLRGELLTALNGLRSEVVSQQDEIFERLRKVESWQAVEDAKRTWPRAVGRWAATLSIGVLLAGINIVTR